MDVVRSHILGRNCASSDHSVLANMHAGKDRRVVRDTHVVVYACHGIGYVALIDYAMRMAVDIRVVADGNAITDHQAAAIIKQNVAMNDDVVADFDIVPEREFDMLESLEILAAPLEDVRCQ